MKSTQDVMKLTGMSKSRCLQFAREHDLPKFGQMYMWDNKAIALFKERMGKRGGAGRKQKVVADGSIDT